MSEYVHFIVEHKDFFDEKGVILSEKTKEIDIIIEKLG